MTPPPKDTCVDFLDNVVASEPSIYVPTAREEEISLSNQLSRAIVTTKCYSMILING